MLGTHIRCQCWNEPWRSPDLVHEKVEAQRGEEIVQRHTAQQGQNPGLRTDNELLFPNFQASSECADVRSMGWAMTPALALA